MQQLGAFRYNLCNKQTLIIITVWLVDTLVQVNSISTPTTQYQHHTETKDGTAYVYFSVVLTIHGLS